MRVLSFSPKGTFGANTYLVISDNEAVVIDPSVPPSAVQQKADLNSLKLKAVLLTHAHFDHMLEIDAWCNEFDIEPQLGQADAPALADEILNCYGLFFGTKKGYYGSYKTLSGGDKISFGSTALRVIETPGHTKGAIALYGDESVFVGDTVFEGGNVGRVDLPGGNYSALKSSIEKILALPEDTTVYCGHGTSTTVKELISNFK